LQSFPTTAQKVLSCDEEGISAKIIFHLHVVWKWIEAGLKLSPLEARNQGVVLLFFGGERREEMGGLLLPHHQTFPNSFQAAIPGSLSLFTKVTAKTFIT
jgi:hypothetical protein